MYVLLGMCAGLHLGKLLRCKLTIYLSLLSSEHLLLSLLQQHLLLRGESNSTTHLRGIRHGSLAHHWSLLWHCMSRAAVVHSLSWCNVAHDWRGMCHRWRTLGHLRRTVSTCSLLAPGRCHRVAHDIRVAVLHGRRGARWASRLLRCADAHGDSLCCHIVTNQW